MLIYGGWAFLILLIGAYALSLYEWGGMSRKTAKPLLFTLVGGCYITISMLALGQMRFMPEIGLGLTVAVFACVWMSDTTAYLFGKYFKGPKLAPSISPNKTIAGLIGAMTGSVIAIFVCNEIFGYDKIQGLADIALLVLIGAVGGVVAQAGDLMVSMMKRHVKVKDTGHLIPGHGGILDRIDSMLLFVPFFYLLVTVFL